MLLHLVRHGRPVVDPDSPAREWKLDPGGVEVIEALRNALPASAREAAWLSSDERKALETAQHLTETDVAVVPELGEAGRSSYLQDPSVFADAVKRGLRHPTVAALPGWETP